MKRPTKSENPDPKPQQAPGCGSCVSVAPFFSQSRSHPSPPRVVDTLSLLSDFFCFFFLRGGGGGFIPYRGGEGAVRWYHLSVTKRDFQSQNFLKKLCRARQHGSWPRICSILSLLLCRTDPPADCPQPHGQYIPCRFFCERSVQPLLSVGQNIPRTFWAVGQMARGRSKPPKEGLITQHKSMSHQE